AARRRGAEALELPLGEGTEDHDAVGQAAGDRRRRVADGGGATTAAAAPLHVREAQLGQAERGGDARGIVAVVAVRGEAVDRARLEPGVRARVQDGVERQLELGLGRAAVLVVRRLADTGDGDAPAQRALAHPASSRIMRATRSGCSRCGAWAAPSTVCTRAPAIRLANSSA